MKSQDGRATRVIALLSESNCAHLQSPFDEPWSEPGRCPDLNRGELGIRTDDVCPSGKDACVVNAQEDKGRPQGPVFFDPENVRCLIDAFDAAWAQVLASGHVVSTDFYAANARFKLASRIMEIAQSGVLDKVRLQDEALASLFPLGLPS